MVSASCSHLYCRQFWYLCALQFEFIKKKLMYYWLQGCVLSCAWILASTTNRYTQTPLYSLYSRIHKYINKYLFKKGMLHRLEYDSFLLSHPHQYSHWESLSYHYEYNATSLNILIGKAHRGWPHQCAASSFIAQSQCTAQ